MAWIIRGLLVISGVIASWFVARDDSNFEIFSFGIGILLLALVMSLYAFWPQIKTIAQNLMRKDTN